ncbi:hypothetical protein BJX61DRAFT_544799 [Aspergillus egyptiacus]|nr:hypothetical protein BJX61DRAFT_544799 [Aspergillus egyptiacus]
MEYTLPLVDRSLAIAMTAAVMVGLSIIAVAFRCFVRFYVVRAFGWDDGLMVAALVLFIALGALCIIGPVAGVGHRLEEFTSLKGLEKAMMWWWLGQIFYLWASAVAKVAIAFALLRLAVRQLHRIILWAVIGTVIVIGLVFWLVLLLNCQPVSYFWERFNPLKSGTCLSTDILIGIAYMYSSITIVCDFTLGLLPAFLIWRLQMTPRTKVALVGILSLGAVASVAVVIRMPFLQYYSDPDFLYSTYQIAIWSVMETGLAIVAGSLITLRPLFRWFLDGSSSYRRDRRGGRGGKYPLTSLTHDPSQPGSQEPRYWRPDILPDENTNVVVTSISSPLGRSQGDSSQEDLNPKGNSRHKNQVSVHQTFMMSHDPY